jgi:LysR family transcriptional activator of nhaA
MEWLNYHHLRYFWTVAKVGSVKQAAAKLHVSQPSVSEQVRELEDALGEKLFRREGRGLVLTDAGRIAYGYAEDIFALGRELVSALKQRPTAKTLRLYVGVADSFPKLVTNEVLKPVFSLPQTVHVICREGKMLDLLAQLTAHRLDIVLADEPSSSSVNFKAFNHSLGETSVTVCAEKKLAARLKRGFPKSLHRAPALLPAENTLMRRAVEAWLREQTFQPQGVAVLEHMAVMTL